jgi:hypothetical protein
MKRIETVAPIVGFCYMRVCAVAEATDEEILEHCNSNNPAGTEFGWMMVIRGNDAIVGPIRCADDPKRTHFLVGC